MPTSVLWSKWQKCTSPSALARPKKRQREKRSDLALVQASKAPKQNKSTIHPAEVQTEEAKSKTLARTRKNWCVVHVRETRRTSRFLTVNTEQEGLGTWRCLHLGRSPRWIQATFLCYLLDSFLFSDSLCCVPLDSCFTLCTLGLGTQLDCIRPTEGEVGAGIRYTVITGLQKTLHDSKSLCPLYEIN